MFVENLNLILELMQLPIIQLETKFTNYANQEHMTSNANHRATRQNIFQIHICNFTQQQKNLRAPNSIFTLFFNGIEQMKKLQLQTKSSLTTISGLEQFWVHCISQNTNSKPKKKQHKNFEASKITIQKLNSGFPWYCKIQKIDHELGVWA